MTNFDPMSTPVISILMEDNLVHTAENGYCCGDPTCYCMLIPSSSLEDNCSPSLTFIPCSTDGTPQIGTGR